MREYILTEPIFKRLSKRFGSPICCYCGKSLKINDKIVSNIAGRYGKTKRYHKQCYEKLFINL